VMSEMGMAMMGSGKASGEDRARIAAETAVASPLLEDIDLAGARGILVNVTAGLDMTIGEFEEVGNTIKEFASENATVVVGTVIDPDMVDELRVTVVATGLGQAQAAAAPVKLVYQSEHSSESVTTEAKYEDLDRPTVMRAQKSSAGAATAEGASLDYLDIPAFLRRQAD